MNYDEWPNTLVTYAIRREIRVRKCMRTNIVIRKVIVLPVLREFCLIHTGWAHIKRNHFKFLLLANECLNKTL